jgi:molybdopterin/thiamine biosynthesis adenylyltransferase
VLVVGVGGLGAGAAPELASRGIGRIGLVDGDRVELSNLHRQLLHGSRDIGRAKAETASATLRSRYPTLAVEARPERLDAENVQTTIAGYDFVIDATDDAPTKFLLNDACVLAGKPFVYAGVVGMNGQLMTILPGETACLRCLFPETPDADEVASCEAAGILGPLAALVGALEAIEAVKYLSGSGELAANRLLTIDARSLQVREIPLRRSAGCPACGTGATLGARATTPPRASTDSSFKETP